MKKINLSKYFPIILRILIALVILFICGFISINTKPPISLQTLGVFFISFLLVPLEALFTTILYLALGAVGVPIFAGVTGGIDVFLGASGGFLISFPVIAFLSSLILRKRKLAFSGLIILFSTMTLLSYVSGTVWIIATNFIEGGFLKVLSSCVLPFIPLDAVKIFAVSKIIVKLRDAKNKDEKNYT